MEAQFLTVKAVAARLKVSLSSVYGLCQQGLLACHRIGGGRGSVRILLDDLQAYLNAVRQASQRPPVPVLARPATAPEIRVFQHLRPPASIGS